ncbi:hypothetical protein ACGFI9_27940 [Micromonospora sp. NPDC048930]|uniref:hypothetical protein n=1 Tax=Micromonospora sp. NPDC048930 TaxID=3364261 RepID=UPI00371B57EE
MDRTFTAVLAAAAVLATTSCTVAGGGTPTTSPPTPSRTGADDREICRDIYRPGTEADLDPARNQKIGGRASLSTTPGMAEAGARLAAAAGQASITDSDPSDRLAMIEAQRDMAMVCRTLFGPGPW